ncbi:MAG TPA: HAMP domain-containing sensor histidine kinase [Stellaceae bacterium]|nr:HAMP domain-containing sensor histidine kinase [Stellaceae bacterium]
MVLRSLSARLLVLTIFFVMLGEVLIFVPSVARFRMTYFEDHLAAAHVATLALIASPTGKLDQALTDELLAEVGVHSITLHRANGMVQMLDGPVLAKPDISFTVGGGNVPIWIQRSFETLFSKGNRVMRVIGTSPFEPDTKVEILLDEQPLREAMWQFGGRIFQLSIILSVMAAVLVYLSLQWLLVRPMRRITASMASFSLDPEDASRVIVPRGGRDEIGQAENELAAMQETVRQALGQRARLAALGTAVTKINHDLRNILATARLVTDGLTTSAAPEVRRVAPRLLDAIDRAIALCGRTLDFSREGAPPVSLSRFALRPLIEEIGPALLAEDEETSIELDMPRDLAVEADRDQIYRVFFNLVRNSLEAGAHRVRITASREDAMALIDIIDDGPGLPPRARENLFRPFAGSARPGGSGLGLAIARELMRVHGGDVLLIASTGAGTTFRVIMPTAKRAAAKPPPQAKETAK